MAVHGADDGGAGWGAAATTEAAPEASPAPPRAGPSAASARPVAPASDKAAPVDRDRKLGLDVPQARIIAPPAPQSGRVVKQSRALTASEQAEAEFRRAAGLLGQGRGSE